MISSNPKSVSAEISDLKTQINTLSNNIKTLKELYIGLNIDIKNTVVSNNIIPPGIASKVAYDSKGLILKGEKLSIDDIPDIPMNKINGLKEAIDTKMNRLESVFEVSHVRGKSICSGTKVNYDENGHIVSSAELLSSDIPELSVSKIKGLVDKLELFESMINKNNENELSKSKSSIAAGTYPKITIDTDGNIISGEKLSIDDIPIDIVNRFNAIESKLIDFASQTSVNQLKMIMDGRENNIQPSNVSDQKLSIKDIPQLRIENIEDLDRTLLNKAKQEDVVKLYNLVTDLISRSNMDINNIKQTLLEMYSKASIDDVSMLHDKIEYFQKFVDTYVIPNTSNDLIQLTLKDIRDRIDTLSGRISTIEQHLKVDDYFDK